MMNGFLLALAATVGSAGTAAETLPPAAHVAGHVVSRPEIKVSVPRSARYAGGDRFALYGIADCDLHVFVDADADRNVRRYYWVQFEQYLPSKPDGVYTYGDNQKMNLWGGTTWVVTGFGRTDQQTRAGSDTEHVRSIIARAGYKLPPTIMQVRMVRVLDDKKGTGHGRHELMLIYAEDLASAGENYQALGGDGDGTARWDSIQPALLRRAAAAFDVKTR